MLRTPFTSSRQSQSTTLHADFKDEINRLKTVSFDRIQQLSSQEFKRLSRDDQDYLFDSLDRGASILDSEQQIDAYLHAYGKMHQAKLNYAFDNISHSFFEHKEINIIDYGCGQAIGAMCYADYLKQKQCNQQVNNITLIEPSFVSLKRAKQYVSSFYPNAKITLLCKKLNGLTQHDLIFGNTLPTLHIFSNIIDLSSFDLHGFASVLSDSLVGENQFVCVSPFFNYYEKDERMELFPQLLNANNLFGGKLLQNELVNDKEWTCNFRCFSIDYNDFEDNGMYLFITGQKLCKKNHEKSDMEDVFSIFMQSAEKHCTSSYACVGCCYENGYGIKKDIDKANEWYRKFIKFGANDRTNWGRIGSFYEKGIGTDKDYEQALYYYNKSAEIGESSGVYHLGECYENGIGVNKNIRKALNLCLYAAELGLTDAQIHLGYNYNNGVWGEKDHVKAFEWYIKAAEQGSRAAQYNLGICYDKGEGVEQNYTKAIKWFTLAAEQGDTSAQVNLGLYYAKGNGVEQNSQKAYEWFSQAAKVGDPKAQYILGICYRNGEGVSKDLVESFNWFMKAAEQGYADAQHELGIMYFEGKGGEKDLFKAYEWLNKAAIDGDKNSLRILSQFDSTLEMPNRYTLLAKTLPYNKMKKIYNNNEAYSFKESSSGTLYSIFVAKNKDGKLIRLLPIYIKSVSSSMNNLYAQIAKRDDGKRFIILYDVGDPSMYFDDSSLLSSNSNQ